MEEQEMYVTKRNGQLEIVSFDKILKRIKKVGQDVQLKLNYTSLTMKVIDQLYDKISTTKIDELTAEQCASMYSIHPEYNVLAGRIVVSNLHKNTNHSFVDVMQQLYQYKDKHDQQSPLVSETFMSHIKSLGGKKVLDKICVYDRDYLIDYFGFKTLEKSYLMKINGKVMERPQHMWLRVAIGIHGTNLTKIMETYEYMSQKYFTHATPTLFNAGTPHPQLSSCYLISMEDDSIDGIFNTLKDCALISKWAGGIGLHIHNVRATGSHIRGTNGVSNGIVPMLKVFNNTAKYVDQCFHPETIIYTTEGPKEIQNCVSKETAIFNRNGKSEIIENVLEHSFDGEILEINIDNSVSTLFVTKQHPFYIMDSTNSLAHAHWVEADHLQVNDTIVIPIPNYVFDINSIALQDCKMYGLLLGLLPDRVNKEAQISVSIHSIDQSSVRLFMVEYFKQNLVNFNIKISGNYTIFSWDRQVHLPFRNSDFYNENGKKRISSKWLNLPLQKIRSILIGILNTDITNSSESMNQCNTDILKLGVVYVKSNMMMETIRYMCIRMGFIPDIQFTKPKTHYKITIPLERMDAKQIFSVPEYLLVQISSIKLSKYSGVLYDLQMKKQHNYLLHHGLVHNGGGKRNGSFAIYLEPWHSDIVMFLQMRKNHGDEELKARDLFYALWIPDLFMERVKTNSTWTLMCPDECPGLSDVYGQAFVDLYTKYETEGKGRVTIQARDLWLQILDAQMETGTPYLLYKDTCNKKSNQKNIGIIKSSNLCTEIIQYSDSTETAVCNLASIALPTCIVYKTDPNDTDAKPVPYFDYDTLHRVAKIVTENLNCIIDINYYPTEKTEKSNLRHRPIGIGVQGLADVFLMLGLPFASDESKKINKHIFETIYHAALEKSCEIAERDGPYETFPGSPASQGILQFDMWDVDQTQFSGRYDWAALKSKIQEKGLRNSLLLAPMPTASTSQILGFNECIEPITSNIYSRRTLAGEFILVNKYLMNDLIALNLWNETLKNNIIANNGSVQHIESIPAEIREKYKTVWEIPMRHLIDMSADRGAFICQSQSLNLWQEDPNYGSLTSMHFYAWSKGLKTGMYYLRRRPKHQAQQFTIEPEKAVRMEESQHDICEMCSA